MVSIKDLKLDSRRIMKEGKFKLRWKVILFLLLTLTISQLVYSLTGYTEYMNQLSESMNESLVLFEEYYETFDEAILEKIDAAMEDYEDAYENYPRVSPVAIFIAVLLAIMMSILSAGFEWWCLLNSRRQTNDFRNMFDGFSFTFKLIALIFTRGLLIAIGMLLFIVPGIILSFAYSQSTYILFENPEKGVIHSLHKSRKLMKGYKGEYFVMNLSFIGWSLLGSIITIYISAAFTIFGLVILSAYASIFFNSWLTPYMGLTRAGFYNHLIGYSITQEQTQPIEEDNTL